MSFGSRATRASSLRRCAAISSVEQKCLYGISPRQIEFCSLYKKTTMYFFPILGGPFVKTYVLNLFGVALLNGVFDFTDN